ncbi:kinesin-like protein KIF19 [Cygnus olor]|uniref:kinesin-like protein KIF19 n=1 Tax=Cygnus olor TaxID=8869 RepID=UPI001ADE6E9B|nr:kinesin-like protein KIF19 [Cygnus olor]
MLLGPLRRSKAHRDGAAAGCPVVALRIRPMSAAELQEGAKPIAHRVDEQVVVLRDPTRAPDDVLRASRPREQRYIFDAAFDASATQETVYRASTRGLVAGVLSGSNATVFAYGPTGCGKTHTMLGSDGEPGVCARALGDLFQAIEDAGGDTEYEVSMSYLEIYNETLRDLLNPSLGYLELREDARGAIQVAGLTEVSATSAEEVVRLLARGNRRRTQEPTAANSTSSRSHAVLQVTVRQRHRGTALRRGRLLMIDLAGSERAAQTQNRGQRMKEGAHINRSLLALGNCIKALSSARGSKYINYRDSKLTRLLKDSLGGKSRTVMIAHISPASTAFEESRSTLAYADRAKSIRTKVRHNLLSASCCVAQCGGAVADLCRDILHPDSQQDSEPAPGKRRDIHYIQGTPSPCCAPPDPQSSVLTPRVPSPGPAGPPAGGAARCLPRAGGPAPAPAAAGGLGAARPAGGIPAPPRPLPLGAEGTAVGQGGAEGAGWSRRDPEELGHGGREVRCTRTARRGRGT